MANWTPIDLGSALLVWLDASDAATITTVTGNVSSWNDKSGSGRNFFQNNTANQPPYAGGKVQIYDQKALIASSSFGNAYDFFVIGKSVGAGKYHSLLLAGGGSYVAFLIDPSDLVGIWTTALHQVTSFTWPADTEAFVYTANSTPLNTTKMAKNGGSLTEIGTTVPDLTFYSVGQPNYAQGFGDLYEFIVVAFNSPLDTKQKLEGYAAWKWGLQGLLPSDHPYKAAPPSTGVADQNIVGTGIASTNAFGTAALSATYSLSPTGIASTNAFGAASLSPAAVNIAATGIGSTTAFGTAALLGTARISAIGIASTTAFGSATIASGAGTPRSISPSGIASTNVFGNTSIGAGTLTPGVLMSPHGNICCDPAYPPFRGPQTLCQVHFRPTAPYPGIVLSPGQEPYPYPLPLLEVRKVYPPTQAGRFTIRGPSATGPWTYRGSWNFGTGSVGTAGHSPGLT